MRKIVLETPNPRDLTVEELSEFSARLELEQQSAKVVIGYQEQRGAGVTLWDVLQFWVPDANFLRDALYGYLINEILQFMRNRRNRPHAEGRPISIVVRLPDGTEVETIIDQGGEVTSQRPSGENSSLKRQVPENQVEPPGHN